jgi:hypothetical protein
MGLDHIRVEIERMRVQIRRQRKGIQQLAKAGGGPLGPDAGEGGRPLRRTGASER